LNQAHQAAVVELGMNHPGEISYLAKMVAPSVVLVNNAQREHLEFMKTVEAVALENGSAIDSLPTDGIVVFPADDAYSYIWRDLAKQRRTITFAADNAFVGGVDVCCLSAEWLKDQWLIQANTPSGLISYRLNIAGRHNIKNSLAAIACSLSVGVSTQSIINGLQAFGPVKGRSFTQTLHIEGRSILLIDDTYNSNPDSMKAAIDSLAEMPSPRLLVMGDMGEVGVQGLTFHAEVGSYAKEKKIDSLFTHGYLSYESAKNFEGGQHFESMDALKTSVASELSNVKSVLVKGSRFMRMERVSQKIIALDRTNTLANIGNKELPHVA
jgi:UDP-N-acetylmuramoyl-tripeptide--D-alanyl-D-alanine ligase